MLTWSSMVGRLCFGDSLDLPLCRGGGGGVLAAVAPLSGPRVISGACLHALLPAVGVVGGGVG